MDSDQDRHFSTDALPEVLPEPLLHKQFQLSDADLAEVELCRGSVNRLGFAVQLCTLRWYGFFLNDLTRVPNEVLLHLTVQLGFLPFDLHGYPADDKTRHAHLDRLRQYLGFRRCDAEQRQLLHTFLQQEAASLPRTELLRKAAFTWLHAHRVVRPGRTTLRDLIASARETAYDCTFQTLTNPLTDAQKAGLDALVKDGEERPGVPAWPRSPLEQLRTAPKKESADTMLMLLERLNTLLQMGFGHYGPLADIHIGMRRHLGLWGYRYDAWSLRRFPSGKRHAILLCFVQMATAETADAVVETLDKLMNEIHASARKRRQQLLRASEEARRRSLEVMEVMGTMALDDAIPDSELRPQLLKYYPREELTRLVEGSRHLREADDGSVYRHTAPSWGTTRRYSPALFSVMPFSWADGAPIGQAISFMRAFNASGKRKFGDDVPVEWLPPKWQPCVISRRRGQVTLSRAHYELALLSVLVEKLKGGDVTVQHSRRWADYEQYLIAKDDWQAQREQHYQALDLPLDVDAYLKNLDERLHAVTQVVNQGLPTNAAVTLNAARGEWKLAPLRKKHQHTEKTVKKLLESRMPSRELLDMVLDLDERLDLLGVFLHDGTKSHWPRRIQRRNVLAALIAVGCNVGVTHMAAASDLSVREITSAIDWYLTEEALRAVSVELVNFASGLPMAAVFGRGDTCSADGMRFYVPVNILAADYSHLLGGRGITMYVHTTDTSLRLYQQPIPTRLREATYVLDGLLDHGTELEPDQVFTDSHGFSEVVMAAAALLSKELAPRLKNINEKTLYKVDRSRSYQHLDPILKGTVKTHVIREVWDDVVRVMASMKAGTATASLLLHRLGSYARQNRVHQAFAEIGRAEATMHVLRTAGSEEYRHLQSRELNKGESAHALSRFLCFGQEGAMRGRDLMEQTQTFSALAVLHNVVVAWNLMTLESVVAQIRAEGYDLTDEALALTTPLMRKHINPFGRYHFDMSRIRD
ncbi:tn3 family transposase Tn4430 [Deinococcus xinjiangensis]|uniref:Tn3 family transposase Tn4430 n=1 Tax=Deinococcus xinjiangensis TaxID=457454 RepID=A0ABP9VGQ4_9DEIO